MDSSFDKSHLEEEDGSQQFHTEVIKKGGDDEQSGSLMTLDISRGVKSFRNGLIIKYSRPFLGTSAFFDSKSHLLQRNNTLRQGFTASSFHKTYTSKPIQANVKKCNLPNSTSRGRLGYFFLLRFESCLKDTSGSIWGLMTEDFPNEPLVCHSLKP